MNTFCKIAFVAVALVAAVSAQIPPAPIEYVWEGMYAPPYITSPQIALAMDCTSANDCYLAGGSNGVGFGVYKYDGKMNGNLFQMNEPNMSLIVTDLAVGGSGTNPHGAFSSIVDFGFGAGLQYLAQQGTEWLPSNMPPELVWASESLTADTAGKNIVAIGSGFTNGLMLSSDYGVTFQNQNLVVPFIKDNCSAPSYIATPAPNAWFMSWASQPAQNNSNVDKKYYDVKTERIVKRKANGQVLVIRNIKTGQTRVHTKTLRELRADRQELSRAKDNTCNYYAGWILKSTDQGKTWTQVYSNPAFATSYVVCYSATSCIVTGFNDDESYTITSTDGNTFKITYTSPPASNVQMTAVQAVGFASETEVWAAGSTETQAAGYGMFWYSKDRGLTWTKYAHTIPDIMAVMAVDFIDGVGFALGITAFKTAQIMRYKKQADYGYFIQSQCPFAGCSLLCQNVSFPQGMCLQAQGGSAKAFCTPAGVMQLFYQTTSCVGSSTSQVQPINVCINGTNTFFENYCPSSVSSSNARKATSKDYYLH